MRATPNPQDITAKPESKVQEHTYGPGLDPPRLKMRSFTISEGSVPTTIEFYLKNKDGLNYDLSEIDDPELKCVVAESVQNAKYYEQQVTIDDASTGRLTITLDRITPGVYRGTVELKAEGLTILENPFLLYVSQSVGKPNGPPSLLEVRLMLRDSSASENLLLDDVAFKDEEIALAAIRPIQYFNEAEPDIGIYFTTSNFPWRSHWIDGMLAQLYLIASEDYRKNNLQYQAGGLSVADKDKERNYLAAYQEKWGQFIRFVANKKGAINMEQAWSAFPSIYTYLR